MSSAKWVSMNHTAFATGFMGIRLRAKPGRIYRDGTRPA
jgi:hypothetical protein